MHVVIKGHALHMVLFIVFDEPFANVTKPRVLTWALGAKNPATGYIYESFNDER
jgi:hypothetical protein